jgi:hypothetical protein
MLHHPARFLVLICALAAPLMAGTVHVPGDYPDIQSALDAVPAGTRILVAGGSWAPIRIEQPVTLVGAPRFVIDMTDVVAPGSEGIQANAITLAGPGTAPGQPPLELCNFETTGQADGFLFGTAGSGVRGTGFREVRLVDAVVRAAAWHQLTGEAQGADAVRLDDVPLLLIERATLIGGFSDTDGPDYWTAYNGGAGLRAVSTDVVVLDSEVHGGAGPHMSFSENFCPEPPCPCLTDSDGGPGLVAAHVLRSGSTIAGGAGQPVYCGSLGMIGFEENGPDVVAASVVSLPHTLSAQGPALAGEMLSIQIDSVGAVAVVVGGAVGNPPLDLGLKGLLFVPPPSSVFVLRGPLTIEARVPDDPTLLGASFSLQAFDADGLGNPLLLVIVE